MRSPAVFFGQLRDILPTVAGAAIGGAVFAFIDLPAPWISGAMIGGLLSRLARPLAEMPVWLRDAGMLIAGASMGAAVTPDTVALMGKVPASFGLLTLSIAVIMVSATLWLTRIHGWGREDAMLASSPGALSTALLIGAARGGDVVGIAVVQTMRLFILVALLPGLIGWLEGAHGGATAALAPPMDLFTLAIMLAGGLLCGFLFMKLRMAAAMMLGAALFGATAHGLGLAKGAMPAPVAIVGFVLIGVMMATRTRGVTWMSLSRYALAGLACFAASAGVAALFAAAASALLDIRPGATLLAFAPGGVEAMTILSISLAYDPLYVAAHHIARFMGIGLALPAMFRLMGDGKPDM